MRKAAYFLLIFLSLILLLIRFGTKPIMDIFGLQPRAGLRVEASQEANVSIDGKEMGKTPFQGEDFKPGDYLVVLKKDDSFWQGYVKLNSGTLSVVNRELASTQASSSGEIITLQKGRGVTIISNPSQSEVSVDGKSYGRTPVQITDLSAGEHLFLISHLNFLKRSIRAVLAPEYNLNLIVDLAISSADFTQVATVPIESSPQVIIKQTPTGFLRVRASPSLESNEVGRVSPGDTLTLLEEISSWYKIRLPDGKEGYISSSYADKKSS